MFIQISGILGGREDSSLQLRRKQISRTRPSLYKIRPLSLSLSLLFLFLSSSSPCRRKRIGRSFKYEYIACRDRRRGADEHSAEQAETILQRRGDKFIPSRGRRATPPRPPLHLYRDIEDPCEKLPMDVSFCPFPSSLSQNPSVSFIWRPVSFVSHP